MHALEVIILRNAEAAGREAAHAVNDGKFTTAYAILAAWASEETKVFNAWSRGYTRGRQEG